MTPTDQAKRHAAIRALDEIAPGMILGLGTGSTIEAGLPELARRIAAGLAVTCVSSSTRTSAFAARLGINIVALESVERIDLSIDGADQIDDALDMIKGAGGAALREKVMAEAAARRIFVVDRSKLVPRLGNTWLPLEILPYGHAFTLKQVSAVTGGEARLRTGDHAVLRSDNGNLLGEVWIDTLAEKPRSLDDRLRAIPGVLATGIFAGLADRVIIGHGDQVTIRSGGRAKG